MVPAKDIQLRPSSARWTLTSRKLVSDQSELKRSKQGKPKSKKERMEDAALKWLIMWQVLQSCHCKLGRKNVNEVVEITNILVYFDGFVATVCGAYTIQIWARANWNRMPNLCNKHYLSIVFGMFVYLFILRNS